MLLLGHYTFVGAELAFAHADALDPFGAYGLDYTNIILLRKE